VREAVAEPELSGHERGGLFVAELAV
jgi:hypothetical protein